MLSCVTQSFDSRRARLIVCFVNFRCTAIRAASVVVLLLRSNRLYLYVFVYIVDPNACILSRMVSSRKVDGVTPDLCGPYNLENNTKRHLGLFNSYTSPVPARPPIASAQPTLATLYFSLFVTISQLARYPRVCQKPLEVSTCKADSYERSHRTVHTAEENKQPGANRVSIRQLPHTGNAPLPVTCPAGRDVRLGPEKRPNLAHQAYREA